MSMLQISCCDLTSMLKHFPDITKLYYLPKVELDGGEMLSSFLLERKKFLSLR